MAGWTEAILFASALGLLVGYFTYRNQQSQRQYNTAKVPIMGPMLAYEYWWPQTNHEKNILLNKLVVVFYIAMAMMTTPFLYLLAIIPLLFNMKWYDEER